MLVSLARMWRITITAFFLLILRAIDSCPNSCHRGRGHLTANHHNHHEKIQFLGRLGEDVEVDIRM